MTGFEPFDSRPVNPSWEAVQLVARLHGRTPDGASDGLPDESAYQLHVAELPCEFARCGERLAELIDEVRPDLVLCVGEAAGRRELSVERVAINVADARIPDNAGRQPIDEPIVPGGPAAYFSALPIKAAVAAARDVGVPAAVSQTAGTYVCNDVFYRLMHLAAERFPQIRGGFVHVPSLPADGTADGGMSADVAAAGLSRVLDACLSRDADIAAVGGAEH